MWVSILSLNFKENKMVWKVCEKSMHFELKKFVASIRLQNFFAVDFWNGSSLWVPCSFLASKPSSVFWKFNPSVNTYGHTIGMHWANTGTLCLVKTLTNLKPAVAMVPVKVEVGDEEGGNNVVSVVVHPPRQPQLAHCRIHQRVTCLPFLPNFQVGFILTPSLILWGKIHTTHTHTWWVPWSM